MKAIMKMGLGLLVVVALSSLSTAVVLLKARDVPKEAPKELPRGVHLQSPQLPSDLIVRTQEETTKAIRRGQELWNDRSLGSNGKNCNMCHADGAATHPETYPKFKQQYGRVVTAQEFINWCIVAALRGPEQEIGGEVLTALEAYQAYANRGETLEIGAPGP
jgi:thiosulfate dehydrogenase